MNIFLYWFYFYLVYKERNFSLVVLEYNKTRFRVSYSFSRLNLLALKIMFKKLKLADLSGCEFEDEIY